MLLLTDANYLFNRVSKKVDVVHWFLSQTYCIFGNDSLSGLSYQCKVSLSSR